MDKENTQNASIQGVPGSLAAPKKDNPLDPKNIIQALVRRWYLVILLMGIGGGVAYVYRINTPNIYRAKAEIEMSVLRPKVFNNEAVYEDDARDEDIVFNTRFSKFKSPAMERLATVEYFKRYPQDDVKNGGLVGKYMLAGYIRDVNWYKDPSANIVYVSYMNSDPEFCAKLVNVLTYCAGLLMMQENQAISDEAVKWLVTQLDEQQEELDTVERQISVLREDLQLDSLEQRKVALQQAIVSVSGEKESLISTLDMRKTVFEYVKELQGADLDLEMLPTGLPKEEQLNTLIDAWRADNEALLLVAGRYKEIHPEYRSAKEKEVRSRKRLDQFIEVSSRAVQNEIELLGKQLAQIEQRLLVMERESLDLDHKLVTGELRLQTLGSRRVAANNAYQGMLRRMEEARLSADENMAYTKVIRNAEVPRESENTGVAKVVATGVVMGGFCGCLIAFVFSLLMGRIESVTDLKTFGMHVLGTLPSEKKASHRNELATIGLHDKFSQMIEVFAGINALLSSNKFSSKVKVVLVSSALPGEGKTIAASNLAISSAMNGNRTLLIDGDLRRPQLSGIFDVPDNHPSLLEWLFNGSGAVSHSELVCPDVVENLDLIIGRPLQEINPAELLGRDGLAELLNWARGRYDRIIIDTPPVAAVGDALVISNLGDAVIIVSRIGKTSRRALRFTLSKFKEMDAFVFGCIANDVPHSISGMFKGAEGYGFSASYGSYKPYKAD